VDGGAARTASSAVAPSAEAAVDDTKKQDAGQITVTLKRVPKNARFWLDGRRLDPPFQVEKDYKQHCIEARAPGYDRYIKCFFAGRDRTLKLYMKRRGSGRRTGGNRPRPMSIYDSPYGN
jgi:hypothetical protein